MPINILRLPSNVIDMILSYLDCEATVRMRKLSKRCKEIVDGYVLRTQVSDLESFGIEGNVDQFERFTQTNNLLEHESKLIITFNHWWDRRLWKNAVRSAMEALDYQRFTLEEVDMQLSHTVLYVTTATASLIRLLDYLKNLTQNLKILTIEISNDLPDILCMYAEFLVDKCVSRVTVIPGGILNFNSCLSLIDQIEPKHITYLSMQGQLTRSSIEFLERIADKCKSLSIYHANHEYNHIIPHPLVPLIKSLMGRKCEKLEIRDHCLNMEFPVADVQKLIQFLHHSAEKELTLLCVSRAERVQFQVGTYAVVFSGAYLSIKRV